MNAPEVQFNGGRPCLPLDANMSTASDHKAVMRPEAVRTGSGITIKPVFGRLATEPSKRATSSALRASYSEASKAESGRQVLDGTHDELQSIGIAKHRNARHARCNLLEYLQPFASDGWFETCETGEVAARSTQVCDNPCAIRIGDANKDDWNRLCRFANRGQDRCPSSQNNLRCGGDKRGSVGPKLSGLPAAR
jgi:hypothetical protein